MGYSPWSLKESDMTGGLALLLFFFSTVRAVSCQMANA